MYGILKFSESLLIAIHSMIILTINKGELMSVKSMSAMLKVSETYTGKILQQLVKAGYLESIRGAKGGFVLCEGAEHTKLLDIYVLLEGKIHIKECNRNSYNCNENCSLNRFVKNMNAQFFDYFENTTIMDVINSNKKK